MRDIGLSMVMVFGPIFVALGLYLLMDRYRSGQLFRQMRVTYAAFAAGVLGVVGVLIVAAN